MESVSHKLRSRREVLRILAVGGAASAAGLGLFSRPHSLTRARVLMGTVVHLTLVGDDPDEAANAAEVALGRMAELEGLLSRYRPGSEVWRLNESGRIEEASDALLEVLRLAERIWRIGDGAFDVSVQPLLDLYRERLDAAAGLPSGAAIEATRAQVGQHALRVAGRTVAFADPGMRITLDGIGKGYVVDRAVAALAELGFPNVFVEAGGDLMAGGQRESGDPWRVGIQRPRASGGLGLQTRFDARNRAVATSGDYMQPFTRDYAQHHILDPRTGYSAPELASATVVAPDAATADALATLVMVLGARQGRALLEDLPDCEGYFISKHLEVTRTSGFGSV